MSTRPHVSRVLATRFSICALSEMRAVTAIASPPAARIAPATSSQGARLRAEIVTLAPASARHSAIARPMPRLAPVTIATLPARSKSRIAAPSQQEIGHPGEQDYDHRDRDLHQSGKADPGPVMLLELGIDHRHGAPRRLPLRCRLYSPK